MMPSLTFSNNIVHHIDHIIMKSDEQRIADIKWSHGNGSALLYQITSKTLVPAISQMKHNNEDQYLYYFV